jgi:hypothetical protein
MFQSSMKRLACIATAVALAAPLGGTVRRAPLPAWRLLLALLAAFLWSSNSARAQSGDPCSLLTQGEAAVALGAPVKAGESAISGCQWGQVGGDGFVQVEVAGARYYQRPPKTAKMIPGIGLEAYSYSDLGSPHATAKTQKSVVVVWASGDKARSERVVDLLRMVVGRIE